MAEAKKEVYDTVSNTIVQSLQRVVQTSNDIAFKQKCLDLVHAEDYETFERRTKRKLTKLLKKHHGVPTTTSEEPATNDENMSSSSVQRVETSGLDAPSSKRKCKEHPLTSSPANQNSSVSQLDFSMIDGGVGLMLDVTEDGGVGSGSGGSSSVDMSILNEFVNGVDSGFDNWFGSNTEDISSTTTNNDTGMSLDNRTNSCSF